MTTSMRWYVVHAYSGQEKSIQNALLDRIKRSGMQDKFGQVLVPTTGGADVLQVAKGRIVVNDEYATSLEKVYAGGDCVGGKVDLTVQAVEDGKRAARSIDKALRNTKTQ